MSLDSSRFFSSFGQDTFSEKIRASIRKELEKKTKKDPNYHEAWKQAFENGSKRLKRANYWKLRLLHNQFQGVGVLGLPVMVRAARFVVKKMKKR